MIGVKKHGVTKSWTQPGCGLPSVSLELRVNARSRGAGTSPAEQGHEGG
jgi:hypothetical protein